MSSSPFVASTSMAPKGRGAKAKTVKTVNTSSTSKAFKVDDGTVPVPGVEPAQEVRGPKLEPAHEVAVDNIELAMVPRQEASS